jgi:excisionase family DNA binding protein
VKEESVLVSGRPLLSLDEARVQAGGVSQRTLRREIRDGRLRVVRLRRRVLIDPRDLDVWIEAAKSGGGDA